MIMAHLIYETEGLLACSLTCYSWYIAAVPHLHHTLISVLSKPSPYDDDRKIDWEIFWPKPLPRMHKLGLLPLVKKLQIHAESYHEFSPRVFNRCILRHFSALANVQELGIDSLNIRKFVPRIRRYFGHFLPTVRSLALRQPKGSRQQIIYFIGLFQHLENLNLHSCWDGLGVEPADDLTLTPPFAPPLRGRLMVNSVDSCLLKNAIDLFGGVRFRQLDFSCNVGEMPPLLAACAKTLETLRLYPIHGCCGCVSSSKVCAF